ncbi:MAG: formimidoylglutamate deiminase [Acidimicrobiales bacterium]
MMQYFCDAAYLDGAGGDAVVTADVLVSAQGARITAVETGQTRPAGAQHLRGLTCPGFANAHSHAFHRALRGRAEKPGTFWTWREEMYALAAALDPDSYRRLARAVFAEMALAGFVAVGEFHYLHHGPDGAPYGDANEMGRALVDAAAGAGVRLTLLDTCYLERAPGTAAEGVQRRFSDGDVTRWVARAEALAGAMDASASEGARVGAAVHSLRAVPPDAAGTVAAWARAHHAPCHVHVSEQQAENDAVAAAYGASPVALLDARGVLGAQTTAVHATHVHPAGAGTLGRSGTTVCMCPTTERALADGVGPAALLAREGSPIALGTDSHAVIDPFEEMRALELDERLESGERGRFSTTALLEAGTAAGHRAIGWPEAGRIAPGFLCDLVTVSFSSVRLAGASAGSLAEHAVFAASASDVTDVVVSGAPVVAGGRHLLVDDVARELSTALGEVWRAAEGAAR